MAVKKRATKKTTARKTARTPTRKPAAKPRKPAKKNQRGLLTRCFSYALVFVIIATLVIGALYAFGSFNTRNQINQVAIRALNAVRSPDWLPSPIAGAFDALFDQIPSSEGLIVDGGELGRDTSPILAGMPQTRLPVRVLQNTSYINMYNESDRQSLCVAFRLTNASASGEKVAEGSFEDPRVRALRTSELSLNEWNPFPIAPPQALAAVFGSKGGNEARLTTNFAPMKTEYAKQVWHKVMQEVAVNYPQRFETVWVYAGPAYREERSKLASGIPIPDAFYVIVFDLTESGGLRAIAFWVPSSSKPETPLASYLTSIGQIEKLTGLRFLPEVPFDAQDVLRSWVSPHLW